MKPRRGYFICQHPDHGAIAEIFSAEEYRKMKRIHTRYIILAEESDYNAAVERLRQVIDGIVQQDRGIRELKQDIKEALR